MVLQLTMQIPRPCSTRPLLIKEASLRHRTVRVHAEPSKPQADALPIASPFSRADVHRTIGGDTAPPRQITIETVDQVLNEVRPYLISDGGNVRVADVQGGRVLLELEGACGTCASSSATMKMGIERSLRAAFGDALEEVVQVNAQQEGEATREAVDSHLDMLRGAIVSLGGSVEVLSVEDGQVSLRYKGPKSIGTGIKAAIRDKFPEIREVLFVEDA